MTPGQNDVESVRGRVTLENGFEIGYHSVGDSDKPLLLMIIGGSGIGSFFYRVAKELSSTFRSVYYDKRGFVPRDSDPKWIANQKNRVVSVEEQADDAAALIKHFSPKEPAVVLGTSCGGTEALDLVVRYPEIVRIAILHEPIAFSFIRDANLRAEMINVHREVGRASDIFKGMTVFRGYWTTSRQSQTNTSISRSTPKAGSSDDEELVAPPKPEEQMSAVELYNLRGNVCEAVAMADYTLDNDKALAVSDKILIITGSESIKLNVSKPAEELASILGEKSTFRILPGNHTSFASKTLAPQWCDELLSALRLSKSSRKQRARI